jgi:hypothetical protein
MSGASLCRIGLLVSWGRGFLLANMAFTIGVTRNMAGHQIVEYRPDSLRRALMEIPEPVIAAAARPAAPLL